MLLNNILDGGNACVSTYASRISVTKVGRRPGLGGAVLDKMRGSTRAVHVLDFIKCPLSTVRNIQTTDF